jgi:hypothetical protein
MGRTKCSIERDPRDDHTICTAVAPELVFTVRTYATPAPYGATPSAQIRTSHKTNPQVTPLQRRQTRRSDKSQVVLSCQSRNRHMPGVAVFRQQAESLAVGFGEQIWFAVSPF